jgi:hypothetical protein
MQQQELVEWIRLVDQNHHQSIDIAVRRILSAISERPFSDEDALIDAVIAWENLFGHGRNVEMTFRVTTSLAILLENDPAKRIALAKELRDIYSLRSRVAHGGEVRARDRLGEQRSRSIEVVVEALRVLFRDRQSLVADRDRGIKLIMHSV